MTTNEAARNWRIPVAIAVFVVAAGSYYAFGPDSGKSKVRDDIEVRITRVDAEKSELGAEFVHPKDGKTYPLVAHIDDECRITIDGKPAELADLRVGDSAIGTGSLDNGVVRALAIRVKRVDSSRKPVTESEGSPHGRTATGG